MTFPHVQINTHAKKIPGGQDFMSSHEFITQVLELARRNL